MKKKVLHFIGSFHQGGSERQAVELVKLLKNEGSFDVLAATLNNQGILRASIDGVGLPAIPEFPLTSFYNVDFVRQLRRCVTYLRENAVDVVHTHDFYTNVFGMTAARSAGVPVRIASKRETGGMRSRAQTLVEKIAFGRANAVIANSTAVSNHLLKELSIDREKVHTIYNGIDVRPYDVVGDGRSTNCKKVGLPDGTETRYITIVANLRHDVKNIPMLLRVAERIVGTRMEVHVIVAGEGELENDLKDLANRSHISRNVHFIGRCENVPALLAISDACILTSKAEGFSNSILEYMAAGKPVVATNVGGASEAVINGETGYLVASDDDEAMANRLCELLDDEERSLAFGERGKRVVSEKFSQEALLRSTLELYDSVFN